MNTTFDLDLQQVSPNSRPDAWREWHETLYAGRLELPERHEELVGGAMRGTSLGEGRLCRIDCAYSGFRIRNRVASDPVVTVWVQLSKASCLSVAGGATLTLSAGDLVFLGSRDDVAVETVAGGEVLLFHAPGNLVRSRLPVWNALRRKLSSDRVGTSILRSALIGAHAAAPLLNAAQRSSVLLSLVELLAVPGSDANSEAEGVGADAHVQSAISFIRERFCDPALSATAVSAASGLSRRRLDELFLRSAGSTVSTTIWNQRLEAARAMLDSTGSVTSVAYACGFSDSAHFSRLFKKRFGAGPSMWRERASR